MASPKPKKQQVHFQYRCNKVVFSLEEIPETYIGPTVWRAKARGMDIGGATPGEAIGNAIDFYGLLTCP